MKGVKSASTSVFFPQKMHTFVHQPQCFESKDLSVSDRDVLKIGYEKALKGNLSEVVAGVFVAREACQSRFCKFWRCSDFVADDCSVHQCVITSPGF